MGKNMPKTTANEIVLAKQGDEKILDKIVRDNEGYVRQIGKKYINFHFYEDILQELRAMIVKCVRNFNAESKTKFSTYLFISLNQSVKTILNKQLNQLNIPSDVLWKLNNALLAGMENERDITRHCRVKFKCTEKDIANIISAWNYSKGEILNIDVYESELVKDDFSSSFDKEEFYRLLQEIPMTSKEKDTFETLYLDEDKNVSPKQLTLREASRKLGISHERVRQRRNNIFDKAKKIMKKSLTNC